MMGWNCPTWPFVVLAILGIGLPSLLLGLAVGWWLLQPPRSCVLVP
jgi:hypothetical protein